MGNYAKLMTAGALSLKTHGIWVFGEGEETQVLGRILGTIRRKHNLFHRGNTRVACWRRAEGPLRNAPIIGEDGGQLPFEIFQALPPGSKEPTTNEDLVLLTLQSLGGPAQKSRIESALGATFENRMLWRLRQAGLIRPIGETRQGIKSTWQLTPAGEARCG